MILCMVLTAIPAVLSVITLRARPSAKAVIDTSIKLSIIQSNADADHAGCPFTGSSTSGACTYIVGRGGTQASVSWSSHRQGCSAASTGEAEVVAIAEASRKSTLPLNDLISQALGKEIRSTLLTDLSAALAAVRKAHRRR